MIHFIVNPSSRTGHSHTVWAEIESYLKEKEAEYEIHQTKRKGHAREFARELSSLSDEVVNLVVVGGDGTINEVLMGITDFSKIRLGIIPAGSGNDFARGLGIKKNVKTNTKRILEAVESDAVPRKIDLGKVTYFLHGSESKKSRFFGISSGIGMDAIVCKKAHISKIKHVLNKLHLGKLTYLILTLQTLFSMKTTSAHITLRAGEGEKTTDYEKVIFVAGMNQKAEGGGVPMAPKASPSDGKLNLCIAHGVPKWRTFLVLPILVAAKHEKLRCFDVKEFESCEILLEEAFAIHADGEYCGECKKMYLECVPDALQVLQ